LQRARAYLRGGRIYFYDPCKDLKKFIADSARCQLPVGYEPTLNKISVIISFSFTEDNKNCFRRYDIDNMIKLYLDAFNKVLYKDDNQVCAIVATKQMDIINNVVVSVNKWK